MSTGLLELSLTHIDPRFLVFSTSLDMRGPTSDLWKSSHNDPIDAVLWSEVDELLFDPLRGPVPRAWSWDFLPLKALAFWGHVSNDVPCLSHVPCFELPGNAPNTTPDVRETTSGQTG